MAKADGAETQIGKREQVSKRNSPLALEKLVMADERHERSTVSTRSSRAGKKKGPLSEKTPPPAPNYDAASQANYSVLIVSGV